MKDAKGHGSNARGTLQKLGIPLGADYHTLHSSKVEGLVDEAKKQGYRKPDDANGSTGRYFHDRLQRQAAREPTSNSQAADALSSTLKATQAPVHPAMNSQGHAYGSPEALKDFTEQYGKPRDHAAEQRSFNSGKREINRLRKQGK